MFLCFCLVNNTSIHDGCHHFSGYFSSVKRCVASFTCKFRFVNLICFFRIKDHDVCNFALADDLALERIHSAQEKGIQFFGIPKAYIKFVGTFLFDSTLKKDLSPASLTLLLPSFLREQEGIASSTKIFSEKVEATETDGAGKEDFSFPKEETPSVEPTETVRRRIKLEEKGRLPNLGEAFDAYVKAKTLTWSAASAKDIPPQVRQFVEIVRELEHGRDIRVDELSREHIRSYFDTLKHLPCRLCGQRQFTGKGWSSLPIWGALGRLNGF